MSLYLPPRKRNMVPRWRNADLTIKLGELRSSQRHQPPIDSKELEKTLLEWKANDLPAYAADVLGAALVYGVQNTAVDAATFLLRTDPKRGMALRADIAKRITEVPTSADDYPIIAPGVRIHELRRMAHNYSSNALVWVDLALAYTNVGQTEKAARYMKVALSLAPNNRYVMRSAVRYYLHVNRGDRARYLLEQSPMVVTDPWLVSAELAVAAILDKSPESLKNARNLLRSSDYSNHDMSELASQMATIQYRDGNRREARKLFAQALQAPTDNSLAQLRSIVDLDSSFDVMVKHPSAPRNFEATALKGFHFGHWSNAIRDAWKWHEDEPFARRAVALGSYIAADVLEDYAQGRDFALAGLKSNPGDPALINNLAFSLAQMSKLAEAKEKMEVLKSRHLETTDLIPSLATRGLILYREGKVVEGRTLYEQAIEKSSGADLLKLKQMALIHLALEEIRAGSPTAPQCVRSALDQSAKSTLPDVIALRDRLQRKSQEFPHNAGR